MPRAAKSKISEIVNSFRTCSLEVMDVMKELVDDVVRERKGKSSKAKARAALPPSPDAPPAAPKKAKAKRAKSVGGKKRGPKPRNQALPLEDTTAYADTPDRSPAGPPTMLTAP